MPADVSKVYINFERIEFVYELTSHGQKPKNKALGSDPISQQTFPFPSFPNSGWIKDAKF
jgi:hypothetical protein